MEKILTVCIPTYNMESLLSRCLDSFILKEDIMRQIEIIVVNDGSKDNSSQIAHQYANKYPSTFIIIDKPNGNYGSCVNVALKRASGKYFRICDADDRYEKENMEEYISFLKRTNVDIVLSPYYTLNIDSEIIKKTEVPLELKGQEKMIDDIDWNRVGFRAMHYMAVLRKILIENNYQQTEGISYTDSQFVFYSFLYSNTCSFFAKPIYYYYIGRDGQTMSKASMAKYHNHFYINAERMLADYVKIKPPVCENRLNLLLTPIKSEVYYYSCAVLRYLDESEEQRRKLKVLIKKSQTSIIPCNIVEGALSRDKVFKMWNNYHIPFCFIRFFRLLKIIK